jgi:predicted Rossmann fold flavoprotein
MAAYSAAAGGAHVILLEKNAHPGRKLNLTGKGRCNLTNNTDPAGLLAAVVRNPRFLYSAFHGFTAQDTMEFFESRGVPLVTERGGRVFPASGRARDITDALQHAAVSKSVSIQFNQDVQAISHADGTFTVATTNTTIRAEAVIIATGGLSYPATGSTGAGYAFARALGHSTTDTAPSLVAMECAEAWVSNLEGLSLRNVRLTLGVHMSEIGEMLFSAHGISGPLVLTASAHATAYPAQLFINMKPALSREQLDARILRDFADAKNKDFGNALGGLLPTRLIPVFIALSDIPPHKKVNEITKAERARLCNLLHALPLTITGTEGYAQAVITRGGVSVGEIAPSTMMSKTIPGLFFAGEVIDTDALTGGYNLQIAFSTGHLAGRNAAQFIGE